MPETKYPDFSDRAVQIMQLAAKAAVTFKHDRVTPGHVLIAFFEVQTAIAYFILKDEDIDPVKARRVVAASLVRRPDFDGQPQPDEDTGKLIEHARAIRTEYGHNTVGTEHLLFGTVRTTVPDQTDIVSIVFRSAGVAPQDITNAILRMFRV